MKITVKKMTRKVLANKYNFRCGFKIGERRSEKQAKPGVEGVLWLNMACTGPWSGDTNDNGGDDDCDDSF